MSISKKEILFDKNKKVKKPYIHILKDMLQSLLDSNVKEFNQLFFNQLFHEVSI